MSAQTMVQSLFSNSVSGLPFSSYPPSSSMHSFLPSYAQFHTTPGAQFFPAAAMLDFTSLNDNENSLRPTVTLENAELWSEFHQEETEMIVTKSGRRMFPTLRYRVSGLDPDASYSVVLELAPIDNFRRKFVGSNWIASSCTTDFGLANQNSPDGAAHRLYTHPDSPAPGRLWMKHPINFNKLKLTKHFSETRLPDQMVVNSMHKYQPLIHVLKLNKLYPSVPELVVTAAFPETSFVVVTAYQNEKIIRLKVDHNPFAKGFREKNAASKAGPLKRPSVASSSSTTETETSSDDSLGGPDSKMLRRASSSNESISSCSATSNPGTAISPLNFARGRGSAFQEVGSPLQAFVEATEKQQLNDNSLTATQIPVFPFPMAASIANVPSSFPFVHPLALAPFSPFFMGCHPPVAAMLPQPWLPSFYQNAMQP